ncbi:MAG: ATP-binding protein [Spirulinaceae cyanobacterium SM2_1_0]|nr:ATP-binding protein [Spirulinaceae cyanobacterium SM2_1_0]
MPSPAARRKSEAGGVLTAAGCQRLQAAVEQDCARTSQRPSFDKIAARAQLSADVAIAILYQQAPARRSELQAFFSAFQLELTDGDYQAAELEAMPKSLPARDLDADLQQLQGRQALLADLAAALQSDCRLVIFTGMPGIGKSTLLWELQRRLAATQWRWVRLDADQQPLSAIAFARAWLGDAAANACLGKAGEMARTALLAKAVEREAIGLAVDTAEQVLADTQPEASLQESVLKIARAEQPQARLAIATPHLPAAWQVIVAQPWARWIPLTGLSTAEAAALFQTWGLELTASTDQQCLATIVSVYQGNPLALKLIAGEIRAYPYGGNLRAYWHDCGAEYELEVDDDETTTAAARPNRTPWLRALVENALRRLERHDPLAYQLLCLGAVNPRPSAAAPWQFLIGDLPEARQQQAWQALRQRLWLEASPADQGSLYRVPSFVRRIVLDQLPPLAPEHS